MLLDIDLTTFLCHTPVLPFRVRLRRRGYALAQHILLRLACSCFTIPALILHTPLLVLFAMTKLLKYYETGANRIRKVVDKDIIEPCASAKYEKEGSCV